MKNLNLLILIIGVTVLFLGCSEDNSLVPNQNDEISLKSKKIPTQFTGVCTPLPNLNPEINPWYDATSDPRVTGVSLWVITNMEPIDDFTYEMTATAEIFVGATEVGGAYVGKWELTCKGTQTMTSPDGSFRIVAHCVGTGTEGDVMGLTAKWKYTMDCDMSAFVETFKYVIKGKITETL